MWRRTCNFGCSGIMQDKTENVPFGSARRACFREGMDGSIMAGPCKRGWQEGLKIPGALADRESSLRSTEAGRVRAAKIPDQPPLRNCRKAFRSRTNRRPQEIAILADGQ